MSYIHSQVHLNSGQAVIVELDHAANVQVMNDQNHARYKRGEKYSFYGGYFRRSPAVIRPPAGTWHVAIDLGGATGQIRARVSVQ